jgi:hypothetical protein
MKKFLVAVALLVLLAFSLPVVSQANESANIPLPMIKPESTNPVESLNIPLPMI